MPTVASAFLDANTRLVPFLLTVVSESPWLALAVFLVTHLVSWAAAGWTHAPGGWLDFLLTEPLVAANGIALGWLHNNLWGSLVRPAVVAVAMRAPGTTPATVPEDAWLQLPATATGTTEEAEEEEKFQAAWPGPIAIEAPQLYAADRELFSAAMEDSHALLGHDLTRSSDGGPLVFVDNQRGWSYYRTDGPARIDAGHEGFWLVLIAWLALQTGASLGWAWLRPPHQLAGWLLWAAAQALLLPSLWIAMHTAAPGLYAYASRTRASASVQAVVVAMVTATSVLAMAEQVHPRWVSLAGALLSWFVLLGTTALVWRWKLSKLVRLQRAKGGQIRVVNACLAQSALPGFAPPLVFTGVRDWTAP